MIINTNIQSVIANNALWTSNNNLLKNSKKLSSGSKINSAGDDPSGMAISNKMKSMIAGLEIADKNSNDAISLIQTAEGALTEVQNMVQRMRELAVQGANDTLTDEDRNQIQEEINQLIDEIDSISNRVEFNGRTLLNAKYDKLTFQVGEKEGMEITFDFEDMGADGLGVLDLDYKTSDNCVNAIDICDNALEKISTYRAKLGAFQNRLEQNVSSLAISTENANNALSRIIDTDMAYEMSEYTKNNILVQSGIAMLSQANQRPNQILSLLQ